MPTPQEIIQGFLELKGFDKMYVLNTLSQEEKDPIFLERDKQVRKEAVKLAVDAGKIAPLGAIETPTPLEPKNNPGEIAEMPLDPEVKAMMEAMQTQIGSIASAFQAQQQSLTKFQVDVARQQLLADIPERVRPLVTGNTLEEIQASANTVKAIYGSLEDEFKTKYSPAPAEAAPPAAADPSADMLAKLQATFSQNPDAFNAFMTQMAQGTAQPPAGAPGAPAAGGLSTATQLPGQQPGTVPGMAPLNPLAPATPDPLVPNPAAGSGTGQQMTMASVTDPNFSDKYMSDPEFRKQVDMEQRSRLGNQPLFVTNN